MHYLISLGLTLAFELVLALLWRVRRRDLILVALVNVLTNPMVVLLHGLLMSYGLLFHTILPEIWAVFTEALIYCRRKNDIRKPILFAIAANSFSYTVGLLLQSFPRL